MFKIRLLSLLFLLSVGQVVALKMTWDHPHLGEGLHVSHQGISKKAEAWAIRETQKEDVLFYQTLLGNPEVMKTMGSGAPASWETIPGRVDGWVEKFAKGNPSGRLVVEQDHKPVGLAHLFVEGRPGVGEFVFAFAPEAQGRGLGTESLGFIVQDWAPALRKRALGIDLEVTDPSIEKFKCFEGQPLTLIYATARPSNQASWKCFTHFDFHPSQPTDPAPQISCAQWEQSQDGPLESYLVKKHFSETSSDQLKPDTLYGMLDEAEKPRTLSFVGKYGSLRYHMEKKVELYSQSGIN